MAYGDVPYVILQDGGCVILGFVTGVVADFVSQYVAGVQRVRGEEIIVLTEVVVAQIPEMGGAPDAFGLERFFRKPVSGLDPHVGQVLKELLAELALGNLIYQTVDTASLAGMHEVSHLDQAPDSINLGGDLGIIEPKIVEVLADVLTGAANLVGIEYDRRGTHVSQRPVDPVVL